MEEGEKERLIGGGREEDSFRFPYWRGITVWRRIGRNVNGPRNRRHAVVLVGNRLFMGQETERNPSDMNRVPI